MLDSVDFTTLILVELVLILVISCGLLLAYALRQRRFYRRVLDEYRKLREAHTSGHLLSNTEASTSTGTNAGNPIAVYLAQMESDAQLRFHKLTQANIPRLAPDLPFSAKIAGLRHLYAQAEAEAYQQGASQQGKWMALERRLADVVRWVTQTTAPQAPKDNRLRLLQERIDVLKPYEVENVRLQRQLAQTRTRQKKMELHQSESRKTIASLEKIIRALQGATGGSLDLSGPPTNAVVLLNEAHDKSQMQLNTIDGISNQKRALVARLVEELHITNLNYTPEQIRKLDEIIKSLEVDLLKSDHHISNLQKQLKASKDKALEQPLFIREKSNDPSEDKIAYIPAPGESPARRSKQEVEEILQVVHNNLIDGERRLQESLDQSGDETDRERVMAEIQQLRLNNQSQRNVIIDLEKELRVLRREAQDTTDEAVSAAKHREISQLERLVKECEHCIETLESEVDLLHKQLSITHQLPTVKTSHSEPEIIQMNMELERLTSQLQQTVKQYQDANILNRFSLDLLECQDIEAIARRLIEAIKEMHVIAGFSLTSRLGKAEYYAGNHFTPQEKLRVKKSPPDPAIGYLNEGILFANEHVRLLLKNPPEVDADQALLESALGGLAKMTGEKLRLIDASNGLERQRKSLGEWISSTKSHLTELDIQYAFQTEESGRVIDQLIKELKRATEMLEISGNTKTVFDNAIAECQQRISQLLNSGKLMDQDFTQLFNDLEQINARNTD